MVLLEVTQSPPLEQAQHPPHCVRQGGQGAAVDLAVGVDAVGAHLQHPLGKAGLHPGDQNAALIGELVGALTTELRWTPGRSALEEERDKGNTPFSQKV